MSWNKYTDESGRIIGIERFGASAPYKILYEKSDDLYSISSLCLLYIETSVPAEADELINKQLNKQYDIL